MVELGISSAAGRRFSLAGSALLPKREVRLFLARPLLCQRCREADQRPQHFAQVCPGQLSLCLETISDRVDVAAVDALIRIYGKPACIVSDNGTEFTSKAILK
ncbi:hypothetical protein ACFQXB_13525 [Plastorhodobacter daqingensis]|uniref:Integrase catalytic domain-containing protein n=1 Tax=Plastorhodobacter daqingensis TaxID=1387281 RepID=A0ABW2UKI5_9RHOB